MRIRPIYVQLCSALAVLLVFGALLALWTGDGQRDTEASHEIVVGGRSAPRVERIEPAASKVRSGVPRPETSAWRDVAAESIDSVAEAEAADEEGLDVETLVAALESPHSRTFAHSVDALSRLDPERLESVLGQQLEEGPLRDDSDESEFRSRAAWELGVVGGEDGVDYLIRAFEGTDPAVREAAAGGLAKSANWRALEFLLEASEGTDPESKSTAISALAFEGGDEGRKLLADAYEEGSITPDDIPDDALEELSIAPEGPGCQGPEWVYPSCSRIRVVSENGAGSGEDGNLEDEFGGFGGN